MSNLNQLKKCKNLYDLADLLGYSAKGISYILYKMDDNEKYTIFKIDKKSGGQRIISKPCPQLMSLQRNLANLIYDCIEDKKPQLETLAEFKGNDQQIPKRNRAKKSISHGYEKGLSSATNAEMHVNKKYVYNIDIESFFPSFNFGRVRGFFLKNKNFNLHPKVATIIAQISCFKNELPQGSPCSPVISNVIAKSLDYYLLRLARKNGCVYTRYVDDLTFSTNLKKFPKAIAAKKITLKGRDWRLGKDVEEVVNNSGFLINVKKCRMQINTSRQEVTGLTVNKKVNVSALYYRNVRAMCNKMFKEGFFIKPETSLTGRREVPGNVIKIFSWFKDKIFKVDNNNPVSVSAERENCNSVHVLHGMLAHVYHIKSYQNRFSRRGYRPSRHDGIRNSSNNKFPPIDRSERYEDENHVVALDGIKNLYGRFLFFKYFFFLSKPMIVCEGKTDNVYLKCAIERLGAKYPLLFDMEKKEILVSFFRRTATNTEMLKMADGTSGMSYLIDIYKRFSSIFQCEGQNFPVIFIVDNDDAGRGVVNKAKKIRDDILKLKGISTKRSDLYFFENLYILPIPTKSGDVAVEELFEDAVRGVKIEGKSLYLGNKGLDPDRHYGKSVFAEKVIKANKHGVNFDGFLPLLDFIHEILATYDRRNNY